MAGGARQVGWSGWSWRGVLSLRLGMQLMEGNRIKDGRRAAR